MALIGYTRYKALWIFMYYFIRLFNHSFNQELFKYSFNHLPPQTFIHSTFHSFIHFLFSHLSIDSFIIISLSVSLSVSSSIHYPPIHHSFQSGCACQEQGCLGILAWHSTRGLCAAWDPLGMGQWWRWVHHECACSCPHLCMCDMMWIIICVFLCGWMHSSLLHLIEWRHWFDGCCRKRMSQFSIASHMHPSILSLTFRTYSCLGVVWVTRKE